MIRAPLLLLACCLVAQAAPLKDPAPLLITGEVKAKPGQMIRLSLTGARAGAAIRWTVEPSGHAGTFDVERQGARVIVSGTAGTYKVTVLAISGEVKDGTVIMTFDEASTLIRFEGAAPPDPPRPPDPPGPGPDPVLLAALQAAYAKDADPDRTLKPRLAALYRQASQPAFLAGAESWGLLFDALAAAGLATVGPPATALPETRKAIASHLRGTLPTVKLKPLDDDGRKLAAREFAKVATALEALK